MVDWAKTHQGQHRQDISAEEAEAQKDAGLTPGITPDLHAPAIDNPAEEQELNLHGDVEGSPYSSTPGEMSLAEAGEVAADRRQAASDDAATREREAESRRTGVSTEALAAKDEADDPDSKPKRARAGDKK